MSGRGFISFGTKGNSVHPELRNPWMIASREDFLPRVQFRNPHSEIRNGLRASARAEALEECCRRASTAGGPVRVSGCWRLEVLDDTPGRQMLAQDLLERALVDDLELARFDTVAGARVGVRRDRG